METQAPRRGFASLGRRVRRSASLWGRGAEPSSDSGPASLAEAGDGVAGALQEVVDLLGRLEADDEGVDGPQAQDEAERGVPALGLLEGALGQDLHADDALAGVMHLLELRG